MGINSENNNENLKQQEAMADAIDGTIAGAQKLSKATDDSARAAAKMGGKFEQITEGLDDFYATANKLDQALNLLPATLHDITVTMNKNMAYVSGELKDSFFKGIINEKLYAVRAELGRETEELRQAMISAQEAVDLAKKSGDQEHLAYAQRKADQLSYAYEQRRNMSDSQKLNKKLAIDMKTELVKIGKQMFSDIWKYAQRILNDAYAKDKSTIEQSYGTVMAYNSYNQGEYAKLIDRLQEKLEASGLGDVISVNTLQENLVKTLQTGLQGALAESNAYYASIAEKAGITFDWYSTDWTTLMSQMERQGRDYEGLMKSMVTITDDLAETYGDSVGLAQGRANQMMTAAANWGTTYGLDESQISNIYKSLAVTSQEFSSYGIDTTKLINDITTAMQSGLSTQEAGILFGTGGATGADVEAKIKAGKFDELIVQYMSNIENLYKGHGNNAELVKALNDALGGSFDINDYAALDTYWSENGSFSVNFKEGFNSIGSTLENVTGELENYVTEQESYETRMENYLADIAEVMVQNPVLEVISRAVQTGLSSIISILTTYLMAKSFMGVTGGGSGSSGTGLLNTLMYGKTSQVLREGVTKTKGGYFYKGGTRISAKDAYTTQTSGGLKNLLSNPKAIGGGMIAAGAIMGVKDSISAGTSAAANWDTYTTNDKWNAVDNTILAAITGHNANLSNAEKMQKAKEGKTFDWGEMFTNAGKGALVGGGIGAVAGGGVFSWASTGIGAAIGAVSGAISNAIQQAMDMKDYKDFVNSDLGKLSETISAASEANDKFITSLVNYQNKVNELKSVQDQLTAAKSGDLELSERELRILENKAKALEYELQLELQKLGDAQDIVDTQKTYIDIINKKGTGIAAYRRVKASAESSGLDENTDWSNISDEYLKAVISDEDLKAMVDSGIIKHTGNDRTTRLGIFQTLVGNSNSNFIGSDYDDDVETDYFSHASTKDGTLESTFDTAVQEATSALNQLSTTGTGVLGTIDAETPMKVLHNAMTLYMEGAYNQLKTTYAGKSDTELQDMLISEQGDLSEMLKDLAPSFPLNKISEYQAYLKNNSVGPGKLSGYYATGTEYVPYDNYIALLHRGEQVRTAAEVAVDKANQHVASVDVASTINDTLVTQTNTIIQILTNIYNIIASNATSAKPINNMVYDLIGT